MHEPRFSTASPLQSGVHCAAEFPQVVLLCADGVLIRTVRSGKYRTVNAFVYIMHEDRPIGIPSDFYIRTCLKGYDPFGFDENILLDAYDRCVEATEDEE